MVLLLRLPVNEARPVWEKIVFTGDIRSGAARVAADVLSPTPPSGFAARLIGSLVVGGRVTVGNLNENWGRPGSSPWGPGCSGQIPPKVDWPSIGVYALLDTPTKSGSKLLVGGIDPIYVTRLVVPIYQIGQIYLCSSYGLTGFTGLTQERRLQILARLLGDGANPIPLSLSPQLGIVFRNAKTYRAQMDAFVHQQLAQFASVTQLLTERGLMTEDERRTTTPHLQISMSDHRMLPRPPLPSLDYGPTVSFVPAGN
jgi:hypothetical protein